MKIAMVNHTFRRTDGQGRVNAEAAASLLHHGHTVTLVGAEVPSDLAEHPSCAVHELQPSRRVPTQLLRHLNFGWKTARVIRRLRASHDVVLANGGMTFARVDVSLCHFVHAGWHRNKHHPLRVAFRRRPLWAVYQYFYTMQAIGWERWAYRTASRVVAVSELVRDQLIESVEVRQERIDVIENGMDGSASVSEETRIESRAIFGVDQDHFVVFFAGELRTARKNLDVLLDAMTLLPDEVVLVAAGAHDGGPYAEMIQSRGLQDRVKLLGFRNDVRALYAGADVFALFSHYEPFGLVVSEAMAAGVPVVTSKSVGASPVVERYGAGLVVSNHESSEEVAAALLTMVNENELREASGQRARDAQEDLSWDRTGERYVGVIQALAAEHHDHCKPEAT